MFIIIIIIIIAYNEDCRKDDPSTRSCTDFMYDNNDE